MYKWFLAKRYLHTKLIAVFAIVSVTLCVAMVLVVISIMDGFLDMVKERSRGLLSDIVIDNKRVQGFSYYEGFQKTVREELPDIVRTTTPVIYNYGILRVPASKYTKAARVLGIRLEEYCAVNTFCEGLHYNRYYPGTTHLGKQQQPMAGWDPDGNSVLPALFVEANKKWKESESDAEEIARYDALPFTFMGGERVFATGRDSAGYQGPEKHGIIIGTDVIYDRQPDGTYFRVYPKGEDMTLAVLPLTLSGTPLEGRAASFLSLPARYADDSRTGVYEIDSFCAYVDFDWLQYNLAMDAQTREDGSVIPPRCSQILVALQPDTDLNEGRRRIEETWNRFRDALPLDPLSFEARLLAWVDVETWEERQRPFIAAVEKEKILMTILFWIISGVAMVLVGCIFYMIVEKKTRDIGILKSLGASSWGVATIFIVYATAIGVIGAAGGTAIGVTFVHYINEIQDWLASLDPNLRVWSPDVYSFDHIPNVVKTDIIMWVAIVAIISSVLGAMIPAIIAGRVWPVKTLRYE